ncbi:MAG TPA: hypothetical protein VGZ22_03470 [Isosphaeraceae bacterium]|nr:hypothetical protein [Isosphaeraceae bacterium]
MTPSLEITLIAVLGVLLAAVSALAGALWARGRTRPLVDVAHLAETLAVRLRTVDRLLARLEAVAGETTPPEPHSRTVAALSARKAARRGATRRFDRAEVSAVTGPTLIAVPDLGASPGEAAAAATELARRFGAIWDLADTGASPEAIARGTGQPIGQVELILGLRRQLGTASAGSTHS